jgi:hypothetical protein
MASDKMTNDFCQDFLQNTPSFLAEASNFKTFSGHAIAGVLA